MSIFSQLLLDQTVRIERFYHRHDEAHEDPEEETAPCYTVNFIERGNYRLEVEKKSWTLDERTVFITHPAMRFRYRHFEELPSDVCLAIDFDDNFAEDIFRTGDFSLKNLSPVVARDNRLAYLQWQISRLVETRDNALAIETLAAELLSALGSDKNKKNVYKTKQLGWYAERIDAIRRLIETRYEEQHTLSSLSRFVGMSPFHLTRIFKELTAQSPHQFLIGVRLAKATERLLAGISVTETCFACGFTNLSHFIRLFGRAFGATPAQFQKRKIKTEENIARLD
jgi:AraC-like DNA-binding protein